VLKKSGVTISAASQPASISASHRRLNLVCMWQSHQKSSGAAAQAVPAQADILPHSTQKANSGIQARRPRRRNASS
jgi:hypothetical protein